MPDLKPKPKLELINLEGTPLDGLAESADPKVREAFEELKLQIGGTDVRKFLFNIVTLGKHVRNIGIRDLIRGSAVVVQAKMFMGINLMEDALKPLEGKQGRADVKQKMLIMDALCGYAEVINSSQNILLKTEGIYANDRQPGDPPAPTRESFQPGQQVKPGNTMVVAQTAHFHQNEANPAAPVPTDDKK